VERIAMDDVELSDEWGCAAVALGEGREGRDAGQVHGLSLFSNQICKLHFNKIFLSFFLNRLCSF
jgi:hypothetical protein